MERFYNSIIILVRVEGRVTDDAGKGGRELLVKKDVGTGPHEARKPRILSPSSVFAAPAIREKRAQKSDGVPEAFCFRGLTLSSPVVSLIVLCGIAGGWLVVSC